VTDHTYKVVDLVGTSPDSIDQAIQNAIERASKTLRGLDWFQVTETRGHIENGRIAHFQVSLKVGFQIIDDKDMAAG
jgi:flavin-binding protein dodecin